MPVINTKIEDWDDDFDKLWGKKVLEENLNASIWPAAYSSSDYKTKLKFIYDLCWTMNEEAQLLMQIQAKLYIDWFVQMWCWARDNGKILVIEKARRMLISWICRCCELHDMGCNRTVMYLGDSTNDDSEVHLYNIYMVYNQIRDRNPGFNLPECKGIGGIDHGVCRQFCLPNGSMCTRKNHSPESYRGKGTTKIVIEEGGKASALRNLLGQASAITMGAGGSKGGQIVVIANANRNPEWEAVKETMNPAYGQPTTDPSWPGSPNGCKATWLIKGGGILIEIDLIADPDKTKEWIENEKRGWLGKIEEWNLEYERKTDILDGSLVYKTFQQDYHVPKLFKTVPWSFNQSASHKFYMGLDGGATSHHPAMVLIELHPCGQIVVAKELVAAPKGEFLAEFIPKVQRIMQDEIPMRMSDCLIYGDMTYGQKSAIDGYSVQQYIQSFFDLRIQLTTNKIAARMGAVNWAFKDTIRLVDKMGKEESTARIIICEDGCPQLCEALRNGYRYDYSTKGDTNVPLKTRASDIVDALSSALVPIQEKLMKVSRGGSGQIITPKFGF